ncbi:MAG: protein kinase [Lachnospiraceae bacterium]|nr:protein kinase [Lachnospiraceae bacterium]
MQKMNGRKTYVGELYSFYRANSPIGSGGNGAVYDVELPSNVGIDFPVVAKFFEYEGRDKEKRYKRFKNEILALDKLKDIDGIMKVVDKKCPQNIPQSKEDAWYLMPKAKPYKLIRKANIYTKILDMLQLAQIIKCIHERDGAHRDIKPENILILDERLVLSDFGLYWGIEEERLTELNERIGPYKIMPPELENVQTDLDLDFRPSDVYLFAKVLWMTLKGDNIGFRGQYQRGDVQIFLNKEHFGNVITLEPIHKLIEKATYEEMDKRISIHQCIDYLELQCKLLSERERKLLSDELVSELLYDEHSKMIIERAEPDQLIYEDKDTIFNMLKGVIPISKIKVKSLINEQNVKQIQLTDFQVGTGGVCKLLYFNNGIKVKEYLLEINKMSYSNLNSDIELELNDIDLVDKEYVAYSETTHGFGNVYPRIYFSSNEKIIIERKKC